MIFCFHMFWKSGHPKFYAPVVEKMKEANNKAFLSRNDLEQFANLLKRLLDAHKPAGHECYIYVSKGNEGGIYIHSGRAESDIARLMFQTVGEILEYDKTADAFYDVSERLEE